MDKLAKNEAIELLERAIESVKRDEVKWIWAAIQSEGVRITVASAGAPKRPQGI